MEKVIISARVEYNIAEALDQIAGFAEVPRGDVIKDALSRYITAYNSAPAPLTATDRQEHAALRAAVRNLMIDGQWRTKTEMADALDVPHCAIEGMLRRWRELSEVKHGAHILDKEQIAPKVWKYRIVV